MINSGSVTVDGVIITRPAELVETTAQINADADHYVSRAAHKLLGALDDLGLSVSGSCPRRRILDRRVHPGAARTGLHPGDRDRRRHRPARAELRRDPRVRELERTNLRDLDLEHVDDQPVDLVVADVSFISLVLLIERFSAWSPRSGRMLLMIKPQFEVGREQLGKGGVVREPVRHRQAIDQVVAEAPPMRLAAAGDGDRAGCSVPPATRSSSRCSPATSPAPGGTGLNMLSQVTRTVAVLTHMGRPAAIDAATRLVEGLSAAGHRRRAARR